jgi:hypothetical protein
LDGADKWQRNALIEVTQVNPNQGGFFLLFPDITEFTLRKSIVRALKIFRGLGWNWKI